MRSVTTIPVVVAVDCIVDSHEEFEGQESVIHNNQNALTTVAGIRSQTNIRHASNEPPKQKILGNYALARTIGEGSFAKVKLAQHRLTNQEVAIKIIDKEKLDEYSLKHLLRETDIMRSLHHPNIIQLYEIIETKKELNIVLEYAAGGEVLDYIVARGKLKESEARRFVRQIVSALEYTHSLGVVHRDLKAENFLLDANNCIKISDFGLSNNFDPLGTLTTSCGSPVYSAPELIEGIPYIGPEVDLWSLGVNLYAMVVGDLPFANNNLNVLYEIILRGKYQVPDFVSYECRDLISKLLVINPKKRFTCRDVKEHVWFTEGLNIIDADSFKSRKPAVPNKLTEADLDQNIIDQIEQMGVDRSNIVNSLLNKKFDQICGTYNILLMQRKNNAAPSSRHSGETSPSILLSVAGDIAANGSLSSAARERTLKKQPALGGSYIGKGTATATAISRRPSIKIENYDDENYGVDNLARVMMMVDKGFDADEKTGDVIKKTRAIPSATSKVTTVLAEDRKPTKPSPILRPDRKQALPSPNDRANGATGLPASRKSVNATQNVGNAHSKKPNPAATKSTIKYTFNSLTS